MSNKKHSIANILSRYLLLAKEDKLDLSVDNNNKFIKA
jgi:hypothetical protein